MSTTRVRDGQRRALNERGRAIQPIRQPIQRSMRQMPCTRALLRLFHGIIARAKREEIIAWSGAVAAVALRPAHTRYQQREDLLDKCRWRCVADTSSAVAAIPGLRVAGQHRTSLHESWCESRVERLKKAPRLRGPRRSHT